MENRKTEGETDNENRLVGKRSEKKKKSEKVGSQPIQLNGAERAVTTHAAASSDAAMTNSRRQKNRLLVALHVLNPQKGSYHSGGGNFSTHSRKAMEYQACSRSTVTF